MFLARLDRDLYSLGPRIERVTEFGAAQGMFTHLLGSPTTLQDVR